MRIAFVGDLSDQDGARLAKAITAALAVADLVVQVGDFHGAYDFIKARRHEGRLLVLPGNHDMWERLDGAPRSWILDLPGVRLVGVDNSADVITNWPELDAVPVDGKPLILFAHKALSLIIQEDGTGTKHIMGEGAPCPDAERLKEWMRVRRAFLCCAHNHGLACCPMDYGLVWIDGRGGAHAHGSTVRYLGYTVIDIAPEGLFFHPVTLEINPS